MWKAPHYNWYGRGFKLRAAITIACQMAFILFGYDQGVFSGMYAIVHFVSTTRLTSAKRHRGQP